MNTEEKIQRQLDENPIILYMKGVPDNPECGFSAKAVAAIKSTGTAFTYVNVLAAPFIREKLPKVSKWPTYPQLFVNGELIGGCDIIETMQENGTLKPALDKARAAVSETVSDGTITHQEVEQLIKADYPDAKVLIAGEGCDLTITVVSNQFESQSLVKQQQGVMATLTEPLGSGRLHAVSVKPLTHAQWEAQNSTRENNGLLQIQV